MLGFSGGSGAGGLKGLWGPLLLRPLYGGFPKIRRGVLSWGPYNKGPTIQGAILGSPIFGNSDIRVWGYGV